MAKLSTTIAADPSEDLAVVREMIHEFEDYVVSDDVYRTLVIKTKHGEERVQSSGGDLLARLHKLAAQFDDLSPDQQRELEALRHQFDQLMADFRSRFRDLLTREAKARLNSLKWYLDECQDDRRQCKIQYPFEIRNRQRLAEIWKMLKQHPPEGLEGQMAAIDRRIRGLGGLSDFVWDAQVKSIYPKDEYWYLYMLPTG